MSKTYQCIKCGATSELKDGFVEKKYFFKRSETWCITCRTYYQKYCRSSKLWILLATLFASVFVGSSYSSYLVPVEKKLLDALAVCLLVGINLYFAIIVHELGHGISAWMVGLKPVMLSFGGGKALLCKKVFGAYWIFSLKPTEGLMTYSASKSRFLKSRIFITALSGPLVNIFAVFLCWFYIKGSHNHSSFQYAEELFFSIGLTNLYFGLISFVPFKVKGKYGEFASDGMKLLTIPFMNKGQIRDLLKTRFTAPSYLAFVEEDYHRCKQLLLEGLKEFPDEFALKDMLAICLIKFENYQEAITLLDDLLKPEDLLPQQKALLLNNLAFCKQYLGDESSLEAADRLSALALSDMPWSLDVRSTRGEILVRRGAIDPGIGLLRDQRYALCTKPDQAHIKCVLAIGYAKHGKMEQARHSLVEAMKLHPDCKSIEPAEKALSSVSEGSVASQTVDSSTTGLRSDKIFENRNDKRSLLVATGSVIMLTAVLSQWDRIESLVSKEYTRFPISDLSCKGHFSRQSIAMDDSTIVVGLPQADTVCVFARQNDTWTMQTKIATPSKQRGNGFGKAVAISQGTIIVGASRPYSPNNVAYIFVRTDNRWESQAVIRPPKDTEQIAFGSAVAVHGNKALVGAPAYDWFGVRSKPGAAYLWIRNGTSWKLQATLRGSATVGNAFGYTVALEGDIAIVSEPLVTDDLKGIMHINPGPKNQGPVHVFHQKDGSWPLEVKLVPSSKYDTGWFGGALQLSDETLLIGAPGTDIGGKRDVGAVFIYKHRENKWLEKAVLLAPDGSESDFFGWSVARSNENIVVGAYAADDWLNENRGAIYLFERDLHGWHSHAKLRGTFESRGVGQTVAANDNNIVASIGSFRPGTKNQPEPVAYVFDRDRN